MADPSTDVFFYHLETRTLDQVLPSLLERTLQRGWRAVVQAGSPERVEALDSLLWTYAEESFLPHGTAKDGNSTLQPVFLTAGDDNPNGATVRFLVDGGDMEGYAGYERVIYIFDGNDPDALARARDAWKRAKAVGLAPTYWQQSAAGGWERKA